MTMENPTSHSPHTRPMNAWTRAALALTLAVLLLAMFGQPPHGQAEADPTATAPRGVHLSYTDDPQTTMTVTWFTDGLADPGTQVAYGETSALGRSVTGTSTPAPGVDVLVHEATMIGLTPGQEVYYQVGAPEAWSEVFTTHVLPPAGEPMRILFMGDHGTDENAQRTSEQLVKEEADLIVIAGDLSYANGKQEKWDLWFDQIEPWASRIPVISAIGNHEYEGDWGTEAYETRMALPASELYYGIDIGRIHMLFLDSYTRPAFSAGHFDEMIEYAEADLEDAAARRDAGELDRILIVQHHPVYSNHESATRKVQPDLVASLEQWMHRYDVDVLVAGHDHHYERSYPMVYSAPTTDEMEHYEDPLGWVQVVTGGAGRSLYNFDHPDDFLPWSATYARRHHYVAMDVEGPTLTFTALSSDYVPGEVLDRFTMGTAQDARTSLLTAPVPLTG